MAIPFPPAARRTPAARSPNSFIGPTSTNTWNVSGTNAGTLNANIAFTNVGNLIGSTGADTFQFQPTGNLSGSLDGGQGGAINTLDDSSYAARTVFSVPDVAASGVHGLSSGFLLNIQSVI